jgi:hypothetical protein
MSDYEARDSALDAHLIALGRCWLCGRSFTFNPDRVPSVPIDPTTGVPPDVGGTDLADAVRQPLCSTCVGIVNERRKATGQDPIYVLPGAYPFDG